MNLIVKALLFCALTPLSNLVWAQGQDSIPGERYLLVMAELLPGIYDNANQHYFDKRRKLDETERHPRINTVITRVDAPAFGAHAFLWVDTMKQSDQEQTSYRIVTLNANGADDEVVMRHYFRTGGMISDEDLAELRPADLRVTAVCDYVFKRRASQFRGVQTGKTCPTAHTVELSETGLWFTDTAFAEPYWLERARIFHCYADIPGVGGGRDIPFERYENFTLHDKGGAYWFTTRDKDKRNLGLVLQSVTWHVLNEENGNFNRDSLVLYTLEKMADGSTRDHGYAFTEPDASRIGYNMKWMLVNCAMTPRNQARPEM